MLDACGVSTPEELFAHLPEEVRLNRPLNLAPGISEYEIVQYFRDRAAECANGYASFLGAGVYNHFRPVLVDTVVSRGEFLTSYTPYQAEIAQGTLTTIFEFQTMICQLTGMDVANASMYDGSTAVPEAAMMAVRATGKGRVLIAKSVHPEYREVLATYAKHQGMPVAEFGYVAESGYLDLEDLERAGGFDRGYLLVATTTGSGWLDSGATDSFEYLTGGDSAIVAMQYSYLPSWLSYLVDQKKAREAGRELFDAVYDRWSKLPPAHRPRLFVFGLSLGSFGGETAFSGEYDLRNRTAGALFAGPPNFNTLYREFTDDRDPGSDEVEPVYKDGRTVRFTNDVAAGVAPTSTRWDGPRVLYLQHPSDPIVWWSPRLIWDRPDWLGEPHGRDVLDAMFWIPLVTFWQVTADLPWPPACGRPRPTTPSSSTGGRRFSEPDWTPDRPSSWDIIATDE